MFDRLYAFTIVTLGTASEALAQATPPATSGSPAAPADDGQRRVLALDHHRSGDHCRACLVLHARPVTGDNRRHDRPLGHFRNAHEPSQGVRQRQTQVGRVPPQSWPCGSRTAQIMAEAVHPGLPLGIEAGIGSPGGCPAFCRGDLRRVQPCQASLTSCRSPGRDRGSVRQISSGQALPTPRTKAMP